MRGAQSKVQLRLQQSTRFKSGAPRLLNTSKDAVSELQPPLLLPHLHGSLWGGLYGVEEFFVLCSRRGDDLSINAAWNVDVQYGPGDSAMRVRYNPVFHEKTTSVQATSYVTGHTSYRNYHHA
jgi:hypothetical protein